MYAVVPPFDEQLEITKLVSDDLAKIHKSILMQIKQIKKLKEYKATLINSAVTGKIKVPGVS